MKPQVHNNEAPAPLTLAPPAPISASAADFSADEEGGELQTRPIGKFETWLPLLYIGAITAAELVFIECYCHWHGAQFLLPNPFNLYSAENIEKLSKIGFVSGSPPTTMDFTAEILMWASLGVWSQRISGMTVRYRLRRPNPPHDLAEYIGILGCHTSIAAAVMIVLKLSGFKMFNISLDSFEACAGTAFILGYFGKETERLLVRMRGQLFGKKNLGKTTAGES
ncbi:MAG: hypothetical protein WAM85_03250 [Terracidiphilus sp.]